MSTSEGAAAAARRHLASRREQAPPVLAIEHPRIYLAGKISRGDWRHTVVTGYATGLEGGGGYHGSADGPSLCGADNADTWPVLKRAVGGVFDYTGPYFNGEGHGAGHSRTGGHSDDGTPLVDGTNHGWNTYCDYQLESVTFDLCVDAIQRSDILFAWLDTLDAYGTLVEIGMAHALGKRVIVAGPLASGDHMASDLWFAGQAADGVFPLHSHPSEVLEQLAHAWKRKNPPVESPIERMLWDAWLDLGEPYELTVAHPVTIKGQNYRLDFAHLPTGTAIELDGYAYHSSHEAFINDRERQRRLTAAGWTFVRYAGKEITDDAAGCAKDLEHILQHRLHTPTADFS